MKITRVWKKDLDQCRSVSTKKSSHLRLVFWKYLAKLFIRSVRSKDVRGWQFSVGQTSTKIWIISCHLEAVQLNSVHKYWFSRLNFLSDVFRIHFFLFIVFSQIWLLQSYCSIWKHKKKYIANKEKEYRNSLRYSLS